MTENEMLKMQQEAVRRAREMQNRARPEPQMPPQRVPKPIQPIRQNPQNEIPLPSVSENNHRQPPLQYDTSGILETLFKDKEKTLILALVLLLIDEKSNNSLILALLYLLI